MSDLSRRRLSQALIAIGAASPMAMRAAEAKSAEPFFASRKLAIGIQLYTLGDLIKTDLDGTLKQVAMIGYKTVELAGYLGKTPEQLRKAFDGAGLKCPSAHIGLAKGTPEEPKLFDDLGRVAEDMHKIGATYVIAPSLAKPDDIDITPQPNEGFRVITRIVAAMTEDHWKRMAQQLNGIGRKFKSSGITFGYHNHNMEFAPIKGAANGRSGYDVLLAETDPKLVTFELDIGWAASAGLEPKMVFAAHPGRFQLGHMKDLKPSSKANFAVQMDPTEVGSGRLDWKAILPAAYKAGVRHFFVEQEPPFEKGRLEAAAICYKYLSTLKA